MGKNDNLMDTINRTFQKLQENLKLINFDAFSDLEGHIGKANRIFVMGKGRSSLAGMVFAMRLVQKGYKVYFISVEMTDLVPPILEGDLLVAVSGSGETSEVLSVARATKESGGNVVAITSWEDSTLAKIADMTIKIVGREKAKEQSFLGRGVKGAVEPPGAYFEILSTIVLESFATQIKPKKSQ
ncbi:MAG: SIS domain-containing protein [Candidatus Jordarchaeaceae archaeon]